MIAIHSTYSEPLTTSLETLHNGLVHYNELAKYNVDMMKQTNKLTNPESWNNHYKLYDQATDERFKIMQNMIAFLSGNNSSSQVQTNNNLKIVK